MLQDNYAETDPENGHKYLTFEDGTRSYFPVHVPKTASVLFTRRIEKSKNLKSSVLWDWEEKTGSKATVSYINMFCHSVLDTESRKLDSSFRGNDGNEASLRG